MCFRRQQLKAIVMMEGRLTSEDIRRLMHCASDESTTIIDSRRLMQSDIRLYNLIPTDGDVIDANVSHLIESSMVRRQSGINRYDNRFYYYRLTIAMSSVDVKHTIYQCLQSMNKSISIGAIDIEPLGKRRQLNVTVYCSKSLFVDSNLFIIFRCASTKSIVVSICLPITIIFTILRYVVYVIVLLSPIHNWVSLVRHVVNEHRRRFNWKCFLNNVLFLFRFTVSSNDASMVWMSWNWTILNHWWAFGINISLRRLPTNASIAMVAAYSILLVALKRNNVIRSLIRNLSKWQSMSIVVDAQHNSSSTPIVDLVSSGRTHLRRYDIAVHWLDVLMKSHSKSEKELFC